MSFTVKDTNVTQTKYKKSEVVIEVNISTRDILMEIGIERIMQWIAWEDILNWLIARELLRVEYDYPIEMGTSDVCAPITSCFIEDGEIILSTIK
jgi:hypothetical protein